MAGRSGGGLPATPKSAQQDFKVRSECHELLVSPTVIEETEHYVKENILRSFYAISPECCQVSRVIIPGVVASPVGRVFNSGAKRSALSMLALANQSSTASS